MFDWNLLLTIVKLFLFGAFVSLCGNVYLLIMIAREK